MITNERDYFVISWNVGAVLSLILPLSLWIVACIFHTSENNNNANSDGSNRWTNKSSNGLLFGYSWSLLVFGLIVWYGNVVFRKQANLLPLLSALVVFCNTSIICLAFVGSSSVVSLEYSLCINCACCKCL